MKGATGSEFLKSLVDAFGPSVGDKGNYAMSAGWFQISVMKQ